MDYLHTCFQKNMSAAALVFGSIYKFRLERAFSGDLCMFQTKCELPHNFEPNK